MTASLHKSSAQDGGMNISDLQAGKAGEYLVCADLILQGFVAFPSEQGLPYDVIVQGPSGLLKIQVKSMRTTAKTGLPPVYKVSAMQCGKRGKKRYRGGDVDIFAFVGLDGREIGYIAYNACKTCLEFRSELWRGQYQSDRIADARRRAKELRKAGNTLDKIGSILGVCRQQVHQYLVRQCVSKGKYLKDFLFIDAMNALNQTSNDGVRPG